MKKVYQAINQVQKELSTEGITKSRKNTQQGYQFRGIDDIYNAIAPLLAKHGLCILPNMLSRECYERKSSSGGALFSVVVEAEFDFVASEDGSSHKVKTYGEAMDSGDKATNKAMSAAYKYAVMQAFSIPTEGDNDADATTHTTQPGFQINPRKIAAEDAAKSISPGRQDELTTMAQDMAKLQEEGKHLSAIQHYLSLKDNDEKTFIWSLLDSSLRSIIKKNGTPQNKAS